MGLVDASLERYERLTGISATARRVQELCDTASPHLVLRVLTWMLRKGSSLPL
jgi:hypothetical protein